MTENIYVIWDQKAEIALKPPFIDRNDVQPVRQFTEVANNPESMLYKSPGDFVLVHVGEIDLEIPALSPVQPRIVITALDAKRPTE